MSVTIKRSLQAFTRRVLLTSWLVVIIDATCRSIRFKLVATFHSEGRARGRCVRTLEIAFSLTLKHIDISDVVLDDGSIFHLRSLCELNHVFLPSSNQSLAKRDHEATSTGDLCHSTVI